MINHSKENNPSYTISKDHSKFEQFTNIQQKIKTNNNGRYGKYSKKRRNNPKHILNI